MFHVADLLSKMKGTVMKPQAPDINMVSMDVPFLPVYFHRHNTKPEKWKIVEVVR